MISENDATGTKWKWSQIKIGGAKLPLRCSMPITLAPNNTAYCFGGVYDEEEDEDLSGVFFNDCYSLDLEKHVWKTVSVSGKKDLEQKGKRRKNKEESDKGKEKSVAFICSFLKTIV